MSRLKVTMMKIIKIFNICFLFVGLFFLTGCSSTATVQIDTKFPSVLAKPEVLSVAVIFDEEFMNYVGTPNEKTSISLGNAQVELLKNAFYGPVKKTSMRHTALSTRYSPILGWPHSVRKWIITRVTLRKVRVTRLPDPILS